MDYGDSWITKVIVQEYQKMSEDVERETQAMAWIEGLTEDLGENLK